MEPMTIRYRYFAVSETFEGKVSKKCACNGQTLVIIRT